MRDTLSRMTFDKTADEMREDLEILHGSSVWNMSDEDVIEEFNELEGAGIELVESDYGNIDEIDTELDNRFGDWNGGVL